MKVLITGGAGFIGTALAMELRNRDHVVSILDNISPQVHSNFDSTPYTDRGISIHYKDIRDRESVEFLVSLADVVIHLASETGTGQSMYEYSHYFDVNVMGTSILLDAIKKHPVKKLIVASSRSVYGEGRQRCPYHGPIEANSREEKHMDIGDFAVKCPHCQSSCEAIATRETGKLNPLSMYAVTKNAQEQSIMLFGKMTNIPTVALRLQNVYGPGQSLSNPYTGILSVFSTRIKNGNDVNIFEDGNEGRDFVYIDDVVSAFMLALDNSAADGEVFNVGSGQLTSVIDIARKLKELFKSDSDLNISGNYRMGDIRSIFGDLDKIKTILSYNPSVKIDEGLSRFVKWVNSQDIKQDKFDASMEEMRKHGILK